MQANRNSGLALILIVFGALILLGGFGHLFGRLMGLIVPIAMIGFGYVGIRNGRTLIGWALMILGAIVLIPKLFGLIGVVIAVGMIVYGISMLKRRTY